MHLTNPVKATLLATLATLACVVCVGCSEYYPNLQVSATQGWVERSVAPGETVAITLRWQEGCNDGPEVQLLKGSTRTRICRHADFSVDAVCDRPGCEVVATHATGNLDNSVVLDLRVPETAGPVHVTYTLTHADTGETQQTSSDLQVGPITAMRFRCLGHVPEEDCGTVWRGELARREEERLDPSMAVILSTEDADGLDVHIRPTVTRTGRGPALNGVCLEAMGSRCVDVGGPDTIRFAHQGRVFEISFGADGSVVETLP